MTLIRSSMALIVALCMGSTVVGCAASSGDGDGDSDGEGSGGGAVSLSGGSSSGGGAGTGGDSAAAGGTASGAGGMSAGAGGAGSGGDSSTSACAPFADFEDSNDGFGVYAQENASAGSLSKPAAGSLGGLATNDTSEGADSTSGSLIYAGSGYDPATVDMGPGGIRFATDLTEVCSDVTTATGLTFWAKGTIDATTEWGGIPANTMIVFLVADTEDEGGTQVDYRLELTSTWTKYEVPFGDFGAEGYSATTVERVKFMISGGTFDIGIDEVGFY